MSASTMAPLPCSRTALLRVQALWKTCGQKLTAKDTHAELIKVTLLPPQNPICSTPAPAS